VQVLDKENAERDNRAPNAFLEALYIDNGKLKFNFDIELDRAMIEELRLGFNQLKVFTFEDGYLNYTPKSTKEIRQEFGKPKSLLEDYDIAYDATEFQKDILYYLALVDGLRFSNSNYSVAIPPRLTKILMKDLEKLETSFRDDETLRKKLAYHIKVELLRENASMISSYIDPEDRDAHSITNEESKNETAKDDQGKEISQPKNGIFIDSNKKRIFYDQAYRNPYTSVVERQANLEDINNRFPAFITSGYDDNVEVYMRVTNPLKMKLHIYL
jgi:hypothetical protein